MEPTRRLVPCEFRCFCSTCTFTFCLAKTEPVQTPWITKLTSLTTQDCCLFLSKSHSLVLNVPWLQFSQTQVSGFSTRVNVWSPKHTHKVRPGDQRAPLELQTWKVQSNWASITSSQKQLSNLRDPSIMEFSSQYSVTSFKSLPSVSFPSLSHHAHVFLSTSPFSSQYHPHRAPTCLDTPFAARSSCKVLSLQDDL